MRGHNTVVTQQIVDKLRKMIPAIFFPDQEEYRAFFDFFQRIQREVAEVLESWINPFLQATFQQKVVHNLMQLLPVISCSKPRAQVGLAGVSINKLGLSHIEELTRETPGRM